MRITDVMSAPVHVVGAETDASEAWEVMRLKRTRHLVVTNAEGRVAGLVSASDLGGKHGEAVRHGRLVADVMTVKVVSVEPEATVREAANLMRGHAVNCLPVLKGGHLVGIVTSLDLLELIGRGAERPVAKSTRRIMKNRGEEPHRQAAAKSLAFAGRAARK